MYLDFYGFKEKPFTITPNPRFIFLSKNHKEVFAHLLYGIRQHAGFIELTGEVGTGKTTVLRTLFNQLEQDPYRLAFIFNPSLSAPELLSSIHQEFGIETGQKTGAELLAGLNEFLLRENTAGRTVVLVIDEAQNLSTEVLEQIRLLSNLETETDKLIQIVLVGQPELGHLLEQPSLRQLSQRITVRYHLRAMDFEDTEAYIVHRLRVAGGKTPIFSKVAVRKIYSYSRGYPRLINVLCDRSLLVGYSEEVPEIGPRQVKTAICELRRESGPGKRRLLWPAILAGLAVVTAGVWFSSWRGSATDALPPAEPVVAHATAASVPDQENGGNPGTEKIERIQSALAALEEDENAALAFNALGDLWKERLIRPGGRLDIPGELVDVAARRDLQIDYFNGSVDALLQLDQPALLELAIPGLKGWRYLALVGAGDGYARLFAAGEVEQIETGDLNRIWSGRGYLLWRNYLGVPTLVLPGARGDHVLQIQELLRESGAFSGEATGVYDAPTVDAVTRFQKSRGIVQDGRIGPQTLMLLYQASPRFGPPRLSADRAQKEPLS